MARADGISSDLRFSWRGRVVRACGALVGLIGLGALVAGCGGSGESPITSSTVGATFTPIRSPSVERCVQLLSPSNGEVWARNRCALVAGRPWFHAVVTNPFNYEIGLDCSVIARDAASVQLFADNVSFDPGRVAGHGTVRVDQPVWLNSRWAPAPAVNVASYEARCAPLPNP